MCERKKLARPFNYLQHSNWKTTMDCYWDERLPAFAAAEGPTSSLAKKRETKLRTKQKVTFERATRRPGEPPTTRPGLLGRRYRAI